MKRLVPRSLKYYVFIVVVIGMGVTTGLSADTYQQATFDEQAQASQAAADADGYVEEHLIKAVTYWAFSLAETAATTAYTHQDAVPVWAAQVGMVYAGLVVPAALIGRRLVT